MANNENDQQNIGNSDMIPEEDKKANDRGMIEGMDMQEGQTQNGELGGGLGQAGNLGDNPPGIIAEDEQSAGTSNS